MLIDNWKIFSRCTFSIHSFSLIHGATTNRDKKMFFIYVLFVCVFLVLLLLHSIWFGVWNESWLHTHSSNTKIIVRMSSLETTWDLKQSVIMLEKRGRESCMENSRQGYRNQHARHAHFCFSMLPIIFSPFRCRTVEI